MKKHIFFLAFTMLVAFRLTAQTSIFPFASTWKYLDNGSNQSTAWQATAFDDGSWKSGPGKFGYGYRDEATVISYGPDPANKYITTYFRKAFALSSVSSFSSFTGRVKRDDGVVVYVNGSEVYRNNLPTGTVSYTTLASSASDNGGTPLSFNIPVSAFVNGTNVIAVEVHQTNRDSFDMVFDLELTGSGGSLPPTDVTPPTVLSINRYNPTSQSTSTASVTFRALFSEAVTGVDAADFQLVGDALGAIASVNPVSGTTYEVQVNNITGSGELGLNLKSSGTGIADQATNPISGGFTGQTYIIQAAGDQTAPTVLGINRQSPSTATTTATTVIFRATFSEPVTGVNTGDFQLTGTALGSIASVNAVSDGTTYDVTIGNITGTGALGLNLKSSGTGIADQANNPISGGFTGQSYTIQVGSTTVGFAAVTNLNPLTSKTDASKGRPQAKVFTYAGKHWAILSVSGGTYLWRLDGRSWTSILRVSSRNARADCILDGPVAHIFLFLGESSELFSVEYDPATATFKPWNKRKTKVDLALDDGVETGTIALDGTGRLWLASDAVTDINIRWADSPYTEWSAPIKLASGVDDDDICAVVAMPSLNKIGVLWSNQKTERFGFRTHVDGSAPNVFTADERPASQSALSEGAGMADDHLDMKITSNGTLFCAVKTGYDHVGFAKIALLVRRPSGSWDDLYKVSEEGTAPIVLVNEALGKVKVVYTSATYGGEILYREAPMSNISFSREFTLISGVSNYATSTHYTYASEVVVLSSNSTQTLGVLASDVSPNLLAAPEEQTLSTLQEEDLQVYPNPISEGATIRFMLPRDADYQVTLFKGDLGQAVYQWQGSARAGKPEHLNLKSAGLTNGLYYARLQAGEKVQILRLLLNK